MYEWPRSSINQPPGLAMASPYSEGVSQTVLPLMALDATSVLYCELNVAVPCTRGVSRAEVGSARVLGIPP